MAPKKGLTLDEHREAGILMKQAYENVIHLQVIFDNAYGKTKEPARSLQKAADILLTAKAAADNIFSAENPAPAKSPYSGAIK
jgi:hypothetical protein